MTQNRAHHKTTVGVLTVGDPSFPYCLAALEQQLDQNFTTEIISGVSPFNAAFQELIRRAKTEFIIQVDEDMLLYPQATKRMQEVMEAAPPNIGMVLFYLYDPDRDQRIHGVKIFRRSALQSVAARDLKASEMDVLEQMHAAGFSWVIHPETMGRHGVVYTPDTIYRRYQTMYEKDISTWNVVVPDIRHKAEAFATSGNPNDLFALLGAARALTGEYTVVDKEKDFNRYESQALNVLKEALLTNPARPFPFVPGKAATKFKSEPAPFETIAWRDNVGIVSPRSIEDNQLERVGPAELVALDDSLTEQIPLEVMGTGVTSDNKNALKHLWLGLSTWRANRYREASELFDNALYLNANMWRGAWYQSLLVRDDPARRSAHGFELAKMLVKYVLERVPSFEHAKTYQLYLTGYFSPYGRDVLVEDFFACNADAPQRFLDLAAGSGIKDSMIRQLFVKNWSGVCVEEHDQRFNELSNTYQNTSVQCARIGSVKQTKELMSRVAIFEAILKRFETSGLGLLNLELGFPFSAEDLPHFTFRGCRPRLIHIGFGETSLSSSELKDIMLKKGYVLWHSDFSSAFFRAAETIDAPNFWKHKTLLPVRQLPAATTVVRTSSTTQASSPSFSASAPMPNTTLTTAAR